MAELSVEKFAVDASARASVGIFTLQGGLRKSKAHNLLTGPPHQACGVRLLSYVKQQIGREKRSVGVSRLVVA